MSQYQNMGFFSQPVHHNSDKVVFITGCDKGIGKESAVKLNSLGYIVIAGCLTDVGVLSFENEYPSIRAEKCNITNLEDVIRIRDIIETEYNGNLHCLVNNAGIVKNSHSLILPLESCIETVSVNLLGTIRVTKTFLPILVKNKDSRIVFLSSVCGLCPIWGDSSYAASKFGIEAYARVLSDELGPFDVQVSIINPGTIRTDMSRGFAYNMKDTFEKSTDEVKDLFGRDYGDRCLDYYSKKIEDVSCDVQVPVTSICSAVGEKYPSKRYYCGIFAKTIFRLGYIFPSFCSFLSRHTAVLPKKD